MSHQITIVSVKAVSFVATFVLGFGVYGIWGTFWGYIIIQTVVTTWSFKWLFGGLASLILGLIVSYITSQRVLNYLHRI